MRGKGTRRYDGSEASGPGEWGNAGAVQRAVVWRSKFREEAVALRLEDEFAAQAGQLGRRALRVFANEERGLPGAARQRHRCENHPLEVIT